MPATQYRSSLLTWVRRTYVATPRNSVIERTTRAKTTNAPPNPEAFPTSASVTVAVDSDVRNIEVRENASFQLIDRVARRLQCSVDRIWRDRGSLSQSPAGRSPCRAV